MPQLRDSKVASQYLPSIGKSWPKHVMSVSRTSAPPLVGLSKSSDYFIRPATKYSETAKKRLNRLANRRNSFCQPLFFLPCGSRASECSFRGVFPRPSSWAPSHRDRHTCAAADARALTLTLNWSRCGLPTCCQVQPAELKLPPQPDSLSPPLSFPPPFSHSHFSPLAATVLCSTIYSLSVCMYACAVVRKLQRKRHTHIC